MNENKINVEWIDVNEKIPYVGQIVLVCGVGEKYISTRTAHVISNECSFLIDTFLGECAVVNKEITHWMEFPKHPKSVEIEKINEIRKNNGY